MQLDNIFIPEKLKFQVKTARTIPITMTFKSNYKKRRGQKKIKSQLFSKKIKKISVWPVYI